MFCHQGPSRVLNKLSSETHIGFQKLFEAKRLDLNQLYQ